MSDLGPRGSRLWTSLLAQDALLEDESNPMREVALQACRTADRLDGLDRLLTGDDDTWARLVHKTQTDSYELKIDAAMSEERQQSQALARLISALRLPDEASGKRPQRRQLRGVQKPSKVSSLDRARQRAGA